MPGSQGDARPASDAANPSSSNVVWEKTGVDLPAREKRNGHPALAIWFTGLSGSGKSTIAKALEARLFADGCQVFMLDGDNVRHGLNGDLGFSAEDRRENIRRIGHTARLLFDAGQIVLCSFISPHRAMRDQVRSLFPAGRFVEAYVKVSLDEARRRDVKGLYAKADAGEIRDFTGVHQPYEESTDPEIILDTKKLSVEEAAELVMSKIRRPSP